MKSYISIVATAALLAVGAPAIAEQVQASPGVTLTEAAQAKFNRDTRGDDQQLVVDESVAMASRGYGQGGDYAQLAASAGLDAAEASGMSLTAIAAAKFAKESSDD